MKLCFVDTETTGLDENKNSIFELAAIVDIDGEYAGRFIENAKPFGDDIISPEALKVTSHTEEEIRGFSNTQDDLKEMFEDFLYEFVEPTNRRDKLFFIAYNAEFDYRFLRRLWEEMSDRYFGSFFWFPYIDLMSLYGWATMEDRQKMRNFRLNTVAKSVGLDVREDNLHSALYDARLAKQLYYKLEK